MLMARGGRISSVPDRKARSLDPRRVEASRVGELTRAGEEQIARDGSAKKSADFSFYANLRYVGRNTPFPFR